MPILRKSDLTPVTGSTYPVPFNARSGYTAWPFSDQGGLTQFGAFVETLHPGAWSSQSHWHEAEDEFLYMLAGEVVLIEDAGEVILRPGDAACWPRGTPNGHHLINRSDQPATYVVAGTRAPEDECHYPDIDLHYSRKDGESGFFHKDGTPYQGWPKETRR